MNKIITLTVNPVLDKESTVECLIPNRKLRCAEPIYFAGGGGINVSRAINNLGSTSLAIYLAGGPTGLYLEGLMTQEGIAQEVIPVKGRTRQNLSVMDTATNLKYRFGVPGPEVHEEEWKAALNQVEIHLQAGDYLVASGKLPPGIPDDFYVKVANIAQKKGARFVLDTKGPALTKAVKSDIFLFKPNLSELSALCHVGSISATELEALAKDFLAQHACEIMVVSLGARGALLVTSEVLEYVPAPLVDQKSIIGAGDSMVAGMVLSLIAGKSLTEMVQYGVACGTAATMHPGTQLCHKEDVAQLTEWMQLNRSKS